MTVKPSPPEQAPALAVSPPPPAGRTGDQRAAIAAALVTVALWASAFVGVRSAGHSLSPGPLALARLLVGSLVLSILVIGRRQRRPATRDLPPVVLCGILWFGFYNVALNAAERHVDAGTAAMLVNVGPVLIALLAGVVLREGFPRSLLIGCAIAFSGAIVIGVATSRGTGSTLGVLLCLAAAFAYAGAVITQKPLLARISALQVTWLACLVGTVACLAFLPSLVHELGRARGSAVAWAVYLGALPTAVAFTTWAFALSRTTAGRMGATTYLVPPLAVMLSWLLLGETPPPLALVGGALCLVGVAVTRRG